VADSGGEAASFLLTMKAMNTLADDTSMTQQMPPDPQQQLRRPAARDPYQAYLNGVTDQLRTYRSRRFAGKDHLFDQSDPTIGYRPPVFLRDHAGWNVICPDGAPHDKDYRARVEAEIAAARRHRWFGSMKSSQALAQSVFGNLKHLGKLSLLADLKRDDGEPLFPTGATCRLEQEIGPFRADAKGVRRNLMGEFEHRGTSVDVLFESSGDRPTRVAVECKFTESEIGRCSKHGVEPECYLTSHGVRYWNFWPDLFRWSPNELTCDTCPAYTTYQLARNLLAACLTDNGDVDPRRGYAVLVYDERNPAFQSGGVGMQAWEEAKRSLQHPRLLQRCSWQQVMPLLERDAQTHALRQEINAKYGI
jgi:hypothetical protein